jgi:hypothetical protein
MANRTVELITSNYGRLVFKNAASEATLRDLINAVDNLEDSLGSTDNTATPTVRNISKKAKSINKDITGIKKFRQVTKQAGKTFVNLLETNTDKASAWGAAVNDNLIKNVPLVGGFLGELGDAVLSAVKIFEGWNDVLKQTSKYGASFNNSVIALRFAAADSYLSLDTFAKLIMENSEALAGIGGTVTQGAFIFSKFNEELKAEGSRVRDELMQMGLTTDDVSERFMNYMTFTLRGVQKETINYKRVTDQFVDYTRLSMLVNQLSGQDAKKSEQEMKAVRDDAAFMAEVNNQDERNRSKLLSVLELSSMINGNAGIKYAEASLKNQKGLSESANLMATLFPNNAQAIDEIMKIAKDTSIDQKEFNLRATEIVAKYGGQLPAQLKKLGKIEDKIAIGAVGMENYKDVVYSALAFQNRMGGAAEMTEENIRNNILKALKEQERRDGITQLLNAFSMAIMTAYQSIMKVLAPLLTNMAEELSKQDLGGKIRRFGSTIGAQFDGMWPKIKNFIAFMASPEGLEFARQHVEKWIRKIWIRMKFWAARSILSKFFSDLFGFDKASEMEQLEMVENAYQALAKALEDTTALKNSLIYKATTAKKAGAFDAETTKWFNENILNKDFKRFVSEKTEYSLGKKVTSSGGRVMREINAPEGSAIMAPFGGKIKAAYGDNGELYLHDEKRNLMFALKGIGSHIDPVTGRDLNKDLLAGYAASIGNYIDAGQVIGYVGKGAVPQLSIGQSNSTYTIDPSELGFRTGTLGQTGNLFANFDPVKGTPALLHGKEAVVTVPQMGQIISSAGQISVAQFITSLNSNINVLISLAREENRVERNKLSAIKNMKLVRN